MNMLKWSKNSLTVGQERGLGDDRCLKEPEGAMLCERPALVFPLTHEEQIHRHGLAVLSPDYTTLEKSHQSLRNVCTVNFYFSRFIFYCQQVHYSYKCTYFYYS